VHTCTYHEFTPGSASEIPNSDSPSIVFEQPLQTYHHRTITEALLQAPVRKSLRIRKPSVRLENYVANIEGELTYKATSQNSQWTKAMDDEIQSHQTMHTWDLVSLPSGAKFIPCKWIFR
jgi:hypothetical protein